VSTKRHLFLTAVGRTGAAGAAAVSAILIAHSLGASALGLFGLLRAVPAIFLLLTEFGISSAAPYLINQKNYSAQSVLSTSIGALLFIGLADLVLWWIASPLVGSHLLRGLPSTWLLFAGLMIPAMAIEGAMMQVLRAKHLFEAANFMRWGLEASILVVIAILAISGHLATRTLVPCLLLAHLVVLVFGGLQLTSNALSLRPDLNRSLLKEGLSFGIRSQIGNTLNMLNYRLDHLILGALTNLHTVGVYVVASKAAEFFRVVTIALTFVLEPQMAQSSLGDAIRRAKRLLLPTFLLNLAVVAVAWIIGPTLIPVLFDEWSVAALFPFQLLLVGLAARGTNGVLVALNSGQGRPELTTYAVVAGFIATIVLDIALIPRWQVVGAAIASSVAQICIAVSLLVSLSILNRKALAVERRNN